MEYIRPSLRTLLAEVMTINPLTTNLSRLLRKNLGSFMHVSTVYGDTISRQLEYVMTKERSRNELTKQTI